MEKAINATTVEVTYKEDVDNINALKFTIDGLTISNAAVKQTDKKTVVLTTSAQTAGVEYTVKESGNEIGKFKGITAVIPTAIDVVTKSIQGVLGKEVTVSAKVTVPAGQSAAGIPVTFNVPAQGSLANAITTEAVTNADGVATYTYTRYTAVTDDVVAYATGDRTKFSAGKVYWATAAQLTLKDVTGVNTLANNDSKVYEINSANNANKYVFVTFKENLGVTADKVVRTVGAKGSSTYLLAQNNTITGTTTSEYPYEILSGAKAVIAVKLDTNGKANLVLSGSNATVTPVVYEGTAVDGTDAGSIAGDLVSEFTNASYSATALQATATALTFDTKHVLGLTIEAAGVANAATYKNTDETGGRDYTVTYIDKDGKPAKAGSPVQIAIPVQTASDNVFLIDADGNKVLGSRVGDYRVFNETVKGTEGKVTFTVGSEGITQYVEPIAFIDNGTGIGNKFGLDTTDLQAKGAATHFTDAVTYSTSLTLVDAAGKEIKSVYANGVEKAFFLYETVDQNGKPRAYRLANGTTAATTVTYTVHAGTSPLTVVGSSTPISAGGTSTYNVSIPADKFSGSLEVTSTAASTATVSATATVAGLVLGTTNTVTATFTSTSVANVTGTVTAVNKSTGIVSISGVPYALSDATYLNNGATVPTLWAFYDHLIVGKTVSVTKDTEGKLVFNVTGAVQGSKESLQAAIIAATAKETAAVAGTAEGQYPAAAITALTTAIAAATTVFNNAFATPAQIETAVTDLATAVATFDKAVVGNQKAALTTKVAEAKALVATVKPFATTGTPTPVWGTDNKANEVQAATLTALTTAIATADVLLADAGAVSADFGAQLTVLTTAITNTNTDLNTYNTAKTALQTAITNAERAHAIAKTGQGNGMFAAADKATLLAAINTAKAVQNGTTTTVANLVSAVAPLNTAKTTFDGTVIAHDVTPVTTTTTVAGDTLTLSFTSSVGPVLAVGATVTLDPASTATATAATVATVDELVITVPTPGFDETIIVPVTVNGTLVKLTFTFDGTNWNVTNQDPAGFVEVK